MEEKSRGRSRPITIEIARVWNDCDVTFQPLKQKRTSHGSFGQKPSEDALLFADDDS